MLPMSMVKAQEKKSEQKIKIIVSDGSGTKVVIDTLIKDGHSNDSIRVKGGKVIFIGDSGDLTGMKHTDGSEKVYVYVSSGDKNEKKDIDKTFDVSVTNDDTDSSVEKTRYVITKDGMVVTVEGTDEAKVKDLIKEIENKMGVKSEDSGKKVTINVETKKSEKE